MYGKYKVLGCCILIISNDHKKKCSYAKYVPFRFIFGICINKKDVKVETIMDFATKKKKRKKKKKKNLFQIIILTKYLACLQHQY